MKKITFLALAFVGGITFQAQAQETITHSESQDVVAGTVVACPTEPTLYQRSFNLESDFDIQTDWIITEVSFGVEVSETADITVNLYTADGDDPTLATLTLIYSGTEATVDGEISVHTVDSQDAVVPSGGILVMELAEAEDGVVFRIGANEAGQTAPSYLNSETCGAGTVESFGFTNHYVMNVTGEEFLSVGDNLSELVSVYPNPANDVLNVNLPSSVEVLNVSMFDILGKEVTATISNGQVNISQLVSGVYLLNIETSAGTLTEKVIKQ